MTDDLSQDDVSALWRRLDMAGHEAVRIYAAEEGWFLDGAAIFLFEGQACRLEYLIECDTEWQTQFVTVDGFVGDDVIAVEIEVDEGVWYLNGDEIPAVEGCVDIDLNFSPATNVLPIKRLGLNIGAADDVRAAWLRFPSFSLEALEQTYSRKSDAVYNYRSKTGFEKDLTVDDFGLVVEYADVWVRES